MVALVSSSISVAVSVYLCERFTADSPTASSLGKGSMRAQCCEDFCDMVNRIVDKLFLAISQAIGKEYAFFSVSLITRLYNGRTGSTGSDAAAFIKKRVAGANEHPRVEAIMPEVLHRPKHCLSTRTTFFYYKSFKDIRTTNNNLLLTMSVSLCSFYRRRSPPMRTHGFSLQMF
ncbi:hypothetical protein OSTOST_24753 [Ostertagia ostertagi]